MQRCSGFAILLWFDVEEKGNTTKRPLTITRRVLWFDVEEKGNTTKMAAIMKDCGLWFDVEEKGNTTLRGHDNNETKVVV